MTTLFVRARSGETHDIPAEEGLSVMQAIRKSGRDDLLALCGGCCSCATCHVYIDDAFLDRLAPMRDDERDLLEWLNHRIANSRLSCQIPLTPALDGLRLTVAPED